MNEEKYKKLLADNRRLSQKLIDLVSKSAISEQKYRSIESAFNVSQQLVQHLKSEQQLLRSVNLFSSDHLLSETAVNSEIIDIANILDDNWPPSVTIDPNHSTVAKTGPDLYKSDSIVVEYEQQIQELRQHLDLLDCLPFDTVVISREDQLKANSHYSAAASVSEPDNNPKDIEIDVMPTTEEKVRHKCKYCGRKYADGTTLDEHKSKHKSYDGQQIRCAEEVCGYQFNTKNELKEHLKTVHRNKDKDKSDVQLTPIKSKTDKRVFRCSECKRQLTTNWSLKQHLKVVHNVVSKYKCRSAGCHQTFDSWSEMKAHKQTHKQNPTIKVIETDETPVIFQHYLATPEASPQQPVPQKTFFCNYEGCHSVYAHKTSLYSHKKKHHSNGVTSVNISGMYVDDSGGHSAPMPPKPVLPTDTIQTKLQLLELFLAEQQKVAEAGAVHY